MRFYSTKNRSQTFSLKEAILQGLAPDGGLFMPESIPPLADQIINILPEMTFQEIALQMARPFLQQDFTETEIERLITQAFDFDVPLVPLTGELFVLELFHGPTLAFKDFGARFMARLVELITQKENKELTILVATSGDTGSAVAHAFYNKKNVRVILLYPSGMVSEIQEKQLTTLGANVTALEIEGTFDDCQRLVKQAFSDKDLRRKRNLTSANSINIARLLPQAFYYAYAVGQLPFKDRLVAVSVPSGNLGNLTGGLIARRMGVPIHQFVAGMNANDVFLQYLTSGRFTPRIVRPTISNAMDVGNPSNFFRILDLFEHDHQRIKSAIYGARFNDAWTRLAIKQAFEKYGYIFDPHGAVGLLAMEKFVQDCKAENWQKIVLETAHPAKFKDVVKESCGQKVQNPPRLAKTLQKEKKAILLDKDYSIFKEWLLS
ncbi:threonine synthase [Calditrichota bacterium GD2]